MRVSGNPSSLESMLGKTFNEVTFVSHSLGHRVQFSNEEDIYIITALRSCCDIYTIDHVEGDLDDLTGVPLLLTVESEGAQILATDKGAVEIHWRSKIHGRDLRFVGAFHRKIPGSK